MGTILLRVLGFLGLFVLACLCSLLLAAATLAGLLVTGPWSGDVAGLAVLVVTGGFGLYYLGLAAVLIQNFWVIGLPAAFREVLVRSLCLLWFPLGSTALPLVARGLGTAPAMLPGLAMTGFFVGWSLAWLTLHARTGPADTNASPSSSAFGGRPGRWSAGRD